jgi:hypothetical protein
LPRQPVLSVALAARDQTASGSSIYSIPKLSRIFVPLVGESEQLPLSLYLLSCFGHAAQLRGPLLTHDHYLFHDCIPGGGLAAIAT